MVSDAAVVESLPDGDEAIEDAADEAVCDGEAVVEIEDDRVSAIVIKRKNFVNALYSYFITNVQNIVLFYSFLPALNNDDNFRKSSVARGLRRSCDSGYFLDR